LTGSLGTSFGFDYFIKLIHLQIHRIPEECWTAIRRAVLLERDTGSSKHLTSDNKLVQTMHHGKSATSGKNYFLESHMIYPLLTGHVQSRWLDNCSQSINMQKKELGQYPAFLVNNLFVQPIDRH